MERRLSGLAAQCALPHRRCAMGVETIPRGTKRRAALSCGSPTAKTSVRALVSEFPRGSKEMDEQKPSRGPGYVTKLRSGSATPGGQHGPTKLSCWR